MSEQNLKQIHHKTKIVATVGPACETYDQLKALVIAGVNVFRLNFSHGTHEDKKKIIDNIRDINKELGCTVAILGDLQGPKLRVGEIENNRLEVKVGDVLTLTNEQCIGTMEKIYVSYPNLAGDVIVGNTIMIDDGKIEVKVQSIEANNDVKVAVSLGGIISSKKGLNLPDTKISLPALTEKDLIDAEFIIKEELDWVALSFVKRVADIEMLRDILNKHKSKSKIIAKIEEGDVVLFFNFRTDRGRELTEVLSQNDKHEYNMHKLNLHYVTMTNYDDNFKNIDVIFNKEIIFRLRG